MGTYKLETTEGQVITQKKCNGVKNTHKLETAEGESSQHTKRIRPSEGYPLSGDHRGGMHQPEDMESIQLSKGHSQTRDDRRRVKLEHGTKVIEQGALTLWRWQREGQVRTCEECD